MWGRNDRLPHSLTPLELALITIRREAYPVVQPPPLESIAYVVADSITIYEYLPSGGSVPRALSRAELRGGLFRRNGAELHFLDGRATKCALAVDVADVRCIIEMLKDPDHASAIHRKFVQARSEELRARSAEILNQAHSVRRRSDIARAAIQHAAPTRHTQTRTS